MSKRDPWVKWFPGDFLNGVSDLEANEICVYVIVLNLIYDKQAPWPYDAKRLARRCRLRQPVLQEVVESLIEYGKLALIDGCLTNEKAESLIGKRQEASGKGKKAAEARWQEENRKSNENNNRQDAKPMQDGCKGDAILEARNQKLDSKARVRPEDDLKLDLVGEAAPSQAQVAFDLYNDLAKRIGATVHTRMTDGWKKSLNARMGSEGIDLWKRALAMVERSSFLCGEVPPRRGERQFKLGLEMILRPDNFQKLLDGFYGEDREAPAAQESADPRKWSSARWARILEIYSVKGEWPDDAGPEPGQAGYFGPPTGDDYGRQ